VAKAWKRKKPKKKKRKNNRTKNQTMARRTCTVCNEKGYTEDIRKTTTKRGNVCDYHML
jgi:5-methylcytosine-specific restriction endonuclease McrA